MSKKKSIKINMILNVFQNIMLLIFPMITYPYATRVLGVNALGKYNFASSIVGYFSLFAGFGTYTLGVREGASLRDDKYSFEKFSMNLLSINMYITVISYFIIVALVNSFSGLKEYKEYIYILALQIFFVSVGRRWIFIIYEDYLYTTARTILFHIISVVLLFVFVKDVNDLQKYCFVSISCTVFSEVANLVCSQKYSRIRLTFKINVEYLKAASVVLGINMSTLIYQNSDMTLLGILTSDYHTGIYGVSVKLYSIIKQVAAAALVVSVPRFSYYVGKQDESGVQRLFEKIISLILLLVIPMAIGVIMISHDIIVLFCGSQYEEAFVSLIILCIAMVINLFGYIFCYAILIPYKKESIFMKATVIGAIFNIILNILFIPILHEKGAALTTVFAELLVTIICGWNIKKYVKIKLSFMDVCTVLIGCVGIVLNCMWIQRCFDGEMIGRLALSVISSMILYCVILLLFKQSNLMNILLRRGEIDQ